MSAPVVVRARDAVARRTVEGMASTAPSETGATRRSRRGSEGFDEAVDPQRAVFVFRSGKGTDPAAGLILDHLGHPVARQRFQRRAFPPSHGRPPTALGDFGQRPRVQPRVVGFGEAPLAVELEGAVYQPSVPRNGRPPQPLIVLAEPGR
jgi:hypothetical protein